MRWTCFTQRNTTARHQRVGLNVREQYASVAFRWEEESNLERNFACSLYARLDNRILYIGRGSIEVIRFVTCAPPLQCFGEGAGGVGLTNYIELRAHSAYSLLRGTSSPEALLAEAARLGMRGLALTDHNNVYGANSFSKDGGVRWISSPFSAPNSPSNPTLQKRKPPLLIKREGVGGGGRGCAALTLLVATETGWENLCWLITQAQHQAPKGEGLLRFEQLQGHTEGLIALSGGREGAITHTLPSRRHERCAASGGALCGAIRSRSLFYRAASSPPSL